MKLEKLLENLKVTVLKGCIDINITDVIYDSRKIKKDCVFVCICGTVRDSHEFIEEAVLKGASAIVIEKDLAVLPDNVTIVKVESSRVALANLSAAYFDYPISKLVSIGVTGTKGKTTTTHMIKSMIEKMGHKVGLIGTNGIIIDNEKLPSEHTTPESYELHEYFAKMVEVGCGYVVMEVSSQGYLMSRVDGITFDYGLFTNITADHIGPTEHKDFEDYLYHKSLLFKNCRVGIVNADDEHAKEILKGNTCDKIYKFGIKNKADYKVDKVEFVYNDNFVGTSFHVSGEINHKAMVNIPGEFNVYNALAAISVCNQLKGDISSAIKSLESIAVEGRMEIIYASKKFSVIVDYAHNAVSMESLLTTLREYKPNRLVCLFGCGGNRSKLRRYDMGEIGGKLADLSIITTDNPRFEKPEDILADIKIGISKTTGEFIEIVDRKKAIHYAVENAKSGDFIVIIGKGHEDYQEIEGVRYPFLDKSVALEALSAQKLV
jgi:UDP-N-acetylmuramyl-tripeptide synthetase